MPTCLWCREPLDAVEVSSSPGVFLLQDCLRPACLQARREALDRRRSAHALSRQRPPGQVVACLPGMHEPYAGTLPGLPPRCRHCEAALPMEDHHDH